jgi:hypothetical protein
MFFLLHTPKALTQVHMFTNPIAISFWQLHTKFYSSKKHESNLSAGEPEVLLPVAEGASSSGLIPFRVFPLGTQL